jgi:hypothetical protein
MSTCSHPISWGPAFFPAKPQQCSTTAHLLVPSAWGDGEQLLCLESGAGDDPPPPTRSPLPPLLEARLPRACPPSPARSSASQRSPSVQQTTTALSSPPTRWPEVLSHAREQPIAALAAAGARDGEVHDRLQRRGAGVPTSPATLAAFGLPAAQIRQRSTRTRRREGWGSRTGEKHGRYVARGDRESLTGGSHLSGRTKKRARNRPCFNIR